ncbi:MAG: tyrosine-protein phosphatase [Planctomycetota bacterium]|nr:tyrosine-protein phosphatase [Planctomycetota bacterium]
MLRKILTFILTDKGLHIALIMAVLIFGAIMMWEYVIRDRIIPRQFGVVEDGRIYRSGQISASMVRKTLIKYNIKAIIELAGDSATSVNQLAEKKVVAELGIERDVFSLRGNGTGDIETYANAVATICEERKEKEPVLVHCRAGAQRTGGVIAAYRLIIEQRDADFVRKEMEHYGFNADNDINLRNFLNNNMMEIARLLKQMGVIDKVPESIPKIRG